VQAEEVKAQANMQIKQMETQFKQQAEQARAMADIEVEKAKALASAQIEAAKAQAKAQADAMAAKYQAEIDVLKHQSTQQTALEVAKMNNEAKIIAAEISAHASAGRNPDGTENPKENPNAPLAEAVMASVEGFKEAIGQLVEAQMRPKQVVRDKTGRVVGVQ
jgi:hypothetical protein